MAPVKPVPRIVPPIANGIKNFFVMLNACSIISSVILGFSSICFLDNSKIISIISGNKTLKASPTFKRLQENFSDNDLIDIMNKVAYNNNQNTNGNKLINNNEMRFKKNSTNPYYEIEKLNSNFLEDIKNDYDVVPVVKLSNFLNQINFNPDVIFMDIEGFEVDVIEDLNENYFHKNKPNIVFEVHEYFYKNNKNLEYLKSILQSANYNMRLDKNNLICLQN